jgi:hypothetical protein
MELTGYLDKYKDKTFKELEFNEIDALIFSSLSYPHYLDILPNKRPVNAKKMLLYLSKYHSLGLHERAKKYISLLREVCHAKRYKGIKFVLFDKRFESESCEQFQAISMVIKKDVFVSFCGTDGTIVGIKEDMNMSYLDITISEIDAIHYIEKIRKKYPRKNIYIVGHSKGGRLAIRAAKSLIDKTKLVAIYAFDSPNFNDDFYDKEFEKIKPLIRSYLPEESIIGRLINPPTNSIIVQSINSLIMQHDTTSWKIDDNKFVTAESYSKRSTRIVNALNKTLVKYDNNIKKEFVDVLFDILDKLNIFPFKKEVNLAIIKEAFTGFRIEWKQIPKEDRSNLKKILFSLIIDFIKK